MAAKANKIDFDMNPAEYKNDFAVLAQRDPAEAADVALKWRERFINQSRALRNTGGMLLEIAIAGGSGALMGGLDGRWEAQREKAIEDWELSGAAEAGTNTDEHPEPWDHAEGVSDPTKLFGLVDKTLALTGVLALLAVFNVFGDTWTRFVKSGALGGFSYWSGNFANKIMKERTKEKLLEASEEETV